MAMNRPGALWAIVQAHIDAQPYHVSDAAIARAVGVATSTITKWKYGHTLPKPRHLWAIARVTGTSYQRVLDAALADAGYDQPHPPQRSRSADRA